MNAQLRTHAGLLLIGLGIIFLIWFAPGLAAWEWAMLGAAIFFVLANRRGVSAAAGYGAFFLGWALGALAADVTRLQSLKLVGTGSGLVLWGLLEKVDWVSWLGGVLAVAGVLVFVWEASLGGWLALALLAIGLYLLLREPREPQQKKFSSSDDYLETIIRWRNEEARRQGVMNTEIISDEELGCLAALPKTAGQDELAGCLGGDKERARALWNYLKA